MKKWIESWLLPLINNIANTPNQKKIIYSIIMIIGIVISWFGITLVSVAHDQIGILDSMKLDQEMTK